MPASDRVESVTLTIFSAPKAFNGHVGIIQDNAIRSWARLVPAPQIILFGQEPADAAVSREVNAQVITDVAANSYGTPLVSDMFKQADRLAHHPLLAFASADVILAQDVVVAAKVASSWADSFLLVSQRRDVDVRARIDFESRGGLAALAATGRLHSPGAIDLFVYPRGQYADMPPFAIGRTAYDNWLLWHTVSSGIPLIDGTGSVTLLHQDHAYSHVPTVDVWNGAEAQENRRWIKHWSNYYTIVHATWKLNADGQIAKATGMKYRLARPRQVLSHALRATRGMRSRFKTWRTSMRYRG